MRKKVCLITGGLGFLGSKFCSFFSSINFEVICIDINKPKRKVKKNIYFYQCDITNEKQVSKLYKKLRNKNIQVL